MDVVHYALIRKTEAYQFWHRLENPVRVALARSVFSIRDPVAFGRIARYYCPNVTEQGSRRPEAQWPKRVTNHLASEGNGDRSSLRDLAREAGVHLVLLPRAFRKHHGCTLGEIMRARKIRKTCGKLRDSHLTIAQVAQETGFAHSD